MSVSYALVEILQQFGISKHIYDVPDRQGGTHCIKIVITPKDVRNVIRKGGGVLNCMNTIPLFLTMIAYTYTYDFYLIQMLKSAYKHRSELLKIDAGYGKPIDIIHNWRLSTGYLYRMGCGYQDAGKNGESVSWQTHVSVTDELHDKLEQTLHHMYPEFKVGLSGHIEEEFAGSSLFIPLWKVRESQDLSRINGK